MKRITSPRALADTDRLFVFLADKGPRAAQRLMSVLKEAIQSLEIFPDRGRPTGRLHIRDLSVRFGRSSYVVRYEYDPEPDTLTIQRIWHGRERRD